MGQYSHLENTAVVEKLIRTDIRKPLVWTGGDLQQLAQFARIIFSADLFAFHYSFSQGEQHTGSLKLLRVFLLAPGLLNGAVQLSRRICG
jgi:hypothetical protein